MTRAEALRRNRLLRRLHPDWSWQEDRIIDRYARRLLQGRYPTTRELLPECRRDLAELYARHPGEIWAQCERSDAGIRVHVSHRATALGVRWSGTPWTHGEDRLALRCARDFTRGRLPSLQAASRACLRALAELPTREASAGGLTVRRPAKGVYARVRHWAVKMGWQHARNWWLPEERHRLEVHARALANGEFASGRAATRHLLAELAGVRGRSNRSGRPVPVKTFIAAYQRVLTLARVLGRRQVRHWPPEEIRRVERYALRVKRGLYGNLARAARAFQRATARDPGRHPSFAGMTPAEVYSAAYKRIQRRLLLRGCPPRVFAWTAAEEAIVDRYARALVQRQFPNLAAAARPLAEELRHCRTEIMKSVPCSYRVKEARSFETVFQRLRLRARAIRQTLPENRDVVLPRPRAGKTRTRRLPGD